MFYYKIFKYAPLQSTTSIVLGILFHEPTFDHREFRYISNFSKIETLFPDLDVKIVEKLLVGIKDQIANVKTFDIEDFTRFYINDFHFEDLKWEEYGDLDGTIERICRNYF